jgi:hypothetical protein
VIAYDGATYGQSASLRMVTDAKVAAVSLANGGDMFMFHRTVISRLIDDATGIEVPGLPVPPENPEPVDTDFVCGRYRGDDLDVEITVDTDGGVSVTEHPRTEELKQLLPGGTPSRYIRLDDHRLIGLQPTAGVHPVIAFTSVACR